jgi:predicted RNA binding protein YcfA (HicA-like mRNA interferase family)
MKKEYSMNEVVKILIDNGYESIGWKGSHLRMRKGDKIVHVSRNTRLNQHYAHTILKKAGIDYRILDG